MRFFCGLLAVGAVVLASAGLGVSSGSVSARAAANAPSGINYGCYIDNQDTYIRYNRTANTSHDFWLFRDGPGVGWGSIQVYFHPRMLGGYDACLYWGAVVGVSGVMSGDWVLARVYYWDAAGQRWERAGKDLWFNGGNQLRSNTSQIGASAPQNYTHAKVLVWYFHDTNVTLPRYIQCRLATATVGASCTAGLSS